MLVKKFASWFFSLIPPVPLTRCNLQVIKDFRRIKLINKRGSPACKTPGKYSEEDRKCAYWFHTPRREANSELETVSPFSPYKPYKTYYQEKKIIIITNTNLPYMTMVGHFIAQNLLLSGPTAHSTGDRLHRLRLWTLLNSSVINKPPSFREDYL